MYRNTDLIHDAVTKLDELVSVPIEFHSQRDSGDGIIEIGNKQFIVMQASEVRNSNKGFVISKLGLKTGISKQPVLLVAKYISKDAAQDMRGKGMNYIDAAGNAYISYKSLYIHIDGQTPVQREKVNQSRAFQEAGVKILFAMLVNDNQKAMSYRAIAEFANVSIGSVSNVIAELEELNYILKTETKRNIKKKQELIERWIVAYNEVLRPRIVRKKMDFINKEAAKDWENSINSEAGQLFQWGGEPAASIMQGKLRPEIFTLYSNAELRELATNLKLVPKENGKVEILNKFWNDGKSLSPTVPPLLIYADLISSGYGRNIEVAESILENGI